MKWIPFDPPPCSPPFVALNFSPIFGIKPIESPPLLRRRNNRDDQGVRESVEKSGAPGRVCGGAQSSGRIVFPVEGALSFRWANIFSITAGSSIQAMILTCPAQRSQVSMSMLNTLQTLHPGHRRMARSGRLVQPGLVARLTPLASPTQFGRGDTHSKFTVGLGLGGMPTNTP